MFSGIVECTGEVVQITDSGGNRRLSVLAPSIAAGLGIGSSVSVDGCCLTAVQLEGDTIRFDLMPITLERTRLGDIRQGDRVNLERSLKMGDEVGGHFVQGHVDGIGRVESILEVAASHEVQIHIGRQLGRFAAQTGSITVNGVSLTIARVTEESITVGIIPHTWSITNFSEFRSGTRVNIEMDMLAKYLDRLIHTSQLDRTNLSHAETDFQGRPPRAV